jgi:FMN phosphatase YigB (HAD superfamily)
MKERYDAWLVDLDGTLYYPNPVKLAMAAELLLFGRAAIGPIRQFRGAHEVLRQNTDTPSENAYEAQLQRTALTLDTDVESLEQVIRDWMHRRPGKWIRLFRRRSLLGEIEAFRSAGGKTALVSDYPAIDKIAALGVASLFDTIVASGEPGGPTRLKPHPEGYLLAAQRLAVAPEACLVLGDRVDADGMAAEAARMAFRRIGW